MTAKSTPVVLITANVGSIFEEPKRMIPVWMTEFLSTITRIDAKFIALHCQEVGGKNYETSMQYVDNFVQLLLASEELKSFTRARIYLDEDFSASDQFTALGNFYLIHESLTDVQIYNFATKSFEGVDGVKIVSKNIMEESTMEKSKFPLEFFTECKWSRKGFLRTRWSINGAIFDLVNIHLFHDASNFIAIQSFPSEYSETRRHALTYTLDRFNTDEHGPQPVFLFGDFNFRTDTQGVVSCLSKGLRRGTSEAAANDETVQYNDDNDEKVLRVGKKTFAHSKHQEIFCDKDAQWLKEYDKELEVFKDQLFEFGISFQPTYPFEEGENSGKEYMQTRCPAWCDRVLLTKDTLPLVKNAGDPSSIEYGLIGRTACMGDHKPVYLKVELASDPAHAVEFYEPKEVEDSVMTSRGDGDASDKVGFVKRVNSASTVENRNRRLDWSSARCNSDVSWNPVQSKAISTGMRKSLFHGSSRIRLVSPTSESAHLSLPRLTSHHSSSDEEWFEEVDGDDDVMVEIQRDVDEIDHIEEKIPNVEKKSFSIFRRLSKKEQEECGNGQSSSIKNSPKWQTLLKRVGKKRREQKTDDLAGSWETIDLNESKTKDGDRVKEKRPPDRNCCVVQ